MRGDAGLVGRLLEGAPGRVQPEQRRHHAERHQRKRHQRGRAAGRKRAPLRGHPQARQRPAAEQAHRERHVDQQPGHLLARPRVQDEARVDPPDEERHDGRLALRAAQAPQQQQRSRERGQECERLVHARQHHVIEPGLAAPRDAVLAQPVADAAHDPAGEPAPEVREHGRVEHDRQRPERSGQAQPGAEAQAVRPAARAPDECQQPRDGESGRQQHHRAGLCVGAVEVRRVPALDDVHQRHQEGQHHRQHHDRDVPARAGPQALAAAGHAQDREGREEGPERRSRQEHGLLRADADGERGRHQEEEARASRLEVAQGAVDPEHGEQRHVHVVAEVPAVEEDRRADGRERRGE